MREANNFVKERNLRLALFQFFKSNFLSLIRALFVAYL